MLARVAAFSLAAALVAPLARADVPPPNSSQCGTKKAGEACTTDDGKSGACKVSTCSRLDYSQTPPGSASYECTLCDETTKPAFPGPEKSGCAASPSRASSGLAAVGFALALGLVARRRGRT